ncbi:MAG: MFS transporter [Gemmataceae bacterium]|nr:MFS transporter [Gemmataceae bacterium]
MQPSEPRRDDDDARPWYRGVSAYQWLVLALASAGWVFDVYEGQIFNITRESLLTELLGVSHDHPDVAYYGDVLLGVFLAGGALGGVLFGMLADRWGRRPVLIATILTYSVFSGLTCLAQNVWQVAILRFLVAMGTGGEWSVAAALVAEVFSARARAQAGAIFHATSVIGTWLAGLAGMLVGSEWRYAYLIGILPALLVVWIRASVKEHRTAAPSAMPEGDRPLPANPAESQGLSDLWRDPRWRFRAIAGLLLAAVGLGTFWAVTIAGQGLAQRLLLAEGLDEAAAQTRARFAFAIVQTTGGGLGLLAFGPLAVRVGRRRAFIITQAAALIIVPVTCYLPATYAQLLALLPVYGFITLSMHAGYAIYFPELFPTRLRATGAGFCFNGGRLVAASMLLFSGWLKSVLELPHAVTLMSGLFVVGILLTLLLPETKGQPLPE